MIVYIQEESDEKRRKIIDRILDDVPTFDKDITEAENTMKSRKASMSNLYEELENEIESLSQYHAQTKYVYIKKDTKPILRECIYELYEIMPSFLVGQKQIWNSMISRLTINILKVGALYALMDYRDYINEHDAKRAAKTMMETMKSVAFFLKDNVRTKFDDRMIEFYARLRRIGLGIRLTEDEWVKKINSDLGMTPENAKTMVKILQENKKFKVALMDGKRLLLLE
jgi:hypothetical protein